MGKRRFKIADSFQQMVGGVLLAGPFVVESGVWDLAKAMTNLQAGILFVLVLAIGYAALYKADKDREPGKEMDFFGVPVRFISLIGVTYSAVILLVLVMSAQVTYDATTVETLRAISIASVFSVIGAATADSVF